MLELFRLEAESQTAVLSAGVLAIEELERSPSTVESLMRAAHSLKGAARIVGLEPAVRVAHSLEDVFVAAGKGQFRVRPAHADLLLAGVDFLSTIARADDALVADSPWTARADDLVARLTAMLSAPAAEPSDLAGAERQSAAAKPAAAQPPAPASPPPAAVEPPAPPASSTESPAPPSPSPIGEPADRVVRVSADSLTRLVGLAGESMNGRS